MASGTRTTFSVPGIMSRSRSAHDGSKKTSAVPQATCVGACSSASLRLDRDQLVRRGDGEEALEALAAVGDERPEIAREQLVGQLARCGVAHAEPGLGAGRLEVSRHGEHQRGELAGLGQRHERPEGLGREVVVHVAVGQRERADSLREAGGEHLRHGAAGVVGDDVDLVEAEARRQSSSSSAA